MDYVENLQFGFSAMIRKYGLASVAADAPPVEQAAPKADSRHTARKYCARQAGFQDSLTIHLRRKDAPVRPKPAISIAQLAGSGTPATVNAVSTKPLASLFRIP